VIGQQTGDHGKLVLPVRAVPMAIDLLQRDDVGVPHSRDDALEIAAAIDTDPVMDVVRGKRDHRRFLANPPAWRTLPD
jgi:hypothetical protein